MSNVFVLDPVDHDGDLIVYDFVSQQSADVISNVTREGHAKVLFLISGLLPAVRERVADGLSGNIVCAYDPSVMMPPPAEGLSAECLFGVSLFCNHQEEFQDKLKILPKLYYINAELHVVDVLSRYQARQVQPVPDIEFGTKLGGNPDWLSDALDLPESFLMQMEFSILNRNVASMKQIFDVGLLYAFYREQIDCYGEIGFCFTQG